MCVRLSATWIGTISALCSICTITIMTAIMIMRIVVMIRARRFGPSRVVGGLAAMTLSNQAARGTGV